MNGIRTTPEAVADVPITPCTNNGTNAIVPTIAIAARPVANTPVATVGCRSRSNGRIGSGARRSTNAKTVSSRPAKTRTPSTRVDVQP
jgi:hypothetical protein